MSCAQEASVVIAISLRPTSCSWNTISFPSTLYTRPVLDVLIAEVPVPWQAEIRLGLQEALVNAVKHGNGLDPSKKVVVEYANHSPIYQWLISDQGRGFPSYRELQRCRCGGIQDTDESGRGTLILTQIFDYVEWNEVGNQLYLGKYIHRSCRQPLVC
jgi:serine/threonine-protein kinase RsbW